MAKNLFANILVSLTFFHLKCFAQNPTIQTSPSSPKNYETQAIKNNNQIEIRLIPKNTPPKSVDKSEEIISSDVVGGESSSTTLNANIQDGESEEDMVYQKSTGEDDFNESQIEKPNKSGKINIEKWREEQRKQREDRIKKRNEEAKQKFQQIKSRSIIRENEEMRLKNLQEQKNNNQKTPSFTTPYYYNPYSPSTIPSPAPSQQNPSGSSSTNSSSTTESPQTTPSSSTNSSTTESPQTTPSSSTNSSSTTESPQTTPSSSTNSGTTNRSTNR